ncbi:class I SAM-dependent methyltransferase [Flammeovirga sp. EKP202]|uniref:class I SAM-dependent methyltransferase n=1 Tax=Flammeovirga sp. EKP202 TaxID=2770592 RepID=UPI00165FE5E5|nr:SAM-dependent methyltransferase [Flammeovirga sp. EKP202]MBD0401841.1 SAM-dependent methyltransferase [Flammeovirga sp. EKP202]
MINQATKQFILEHENEDPSKVIFKAATLEEVDGKIAAHQIVSRQKAKKKLPTWYSNEDVVYPNKIPLEQSSSEQTAKFKAGIFQGVVLADLTGGMGIDDWAFADVFQKVYYCERQEDLAEIAKLNFAALGKSNIEVNAGDSVEWLRSHASNLTAIYLDPARRDAQNNKMVGISDCEPDVIALKELLFEKADKILVKLSPMIDIKQGVRELESVSKVFVIAVENECKEVLFLMEKNAESKTFIQCVDFPKNHPISKFEFQLEEEEYQEVELAVTLGRYLYEPNAAVMKGGGFKSVAQYYSLKKLGTNSHLYTSEALIEDFPGRKFEIKAKSQVQKKALQKLLPGMKANLTVRNFPQTVDQLRKKLKLKEGGNDYLFATTIMSDEKVLLLCERINK